MKNWSIVKIIRLCVLIMLIAAMIMICVSFLALEPSGFADRVVTRIAQAMLILCCILNILCETVLVKRNNKQNKSEEREEK